MKDLSVVIPAFNEGERLPPTLEKVRAYLNAGGWRSELIVSDDGSTDGSPERLPPRFPNVTFLRAPRNQGKGAAVRRGVLRAQGDLILFSDADLSTPIEELEALRRAIVVDGCDIAIASRGLAESRLDVRQPWWRELAGRTFNRLVRPLSGLPFRDTQCGFKLFRREAAHRLFSLARCDGWAFDVEVLMLAAQLGYSVAEVPVRWINAEGSKVRLFVDGPRMLRDILRFRWWRLRGLYRRPAAEPAATVSSSEGGGA